MSIGPSSVDGSYPDEVQQRSSRLLEVPVLIAIWETYGHGIDGREPKTTYGYYSTEVLARREGGEYCSVQQRMAAVVNGRHYLLEKNDPIRLDMTALDKEKEAALAKLSARDKEVLGLK